MTRIILVRHGQTVWNAQGRPRGRAEVPLDAIGRLQAKSIAQYISTHYRPDVIYASPLRRAVQTAKAVAVHLGVDVRSHDGLLDVDFGAWEGRLPEDLEVHWAEAWETWLTYPERAVIPGGETLQAAQERALAALREICLAYADGAVVVVGHTAINRLILLNVLGTSIDHFWNLAQDVAAINILNFDGQDYTLVQMNLTEHLVQSAT